MSVTQRRVCMWLSIHYTKLSISNVHKHTTAGSCNSEAVESVEGISIFGILEQKHSLISFCGSQHH